MIRTRLPTSMIIALALSAPVHAADTKTVELRFVPAPPGAGSIMFSSIAAGPDGRIYESSANEGAQMAHLFVYNPATDDVTDLLDVQEFVGGQVPGMARHTKIHSQLVFDKSNVLWFGTGSAERESVSDRFPKGYPGGHLISYDTKTGEFTDHGILLPQRTETPKSFWDLGEALYTFAIDPERERLYIQTYLNSFFIVYDLPTGR